VTERSLSPGFFSPRARPLVLAHRGASADAPENSRAAFRLARDQGADAVELDVMRCATGEVVVFHDDDLLRMANRPTLVRDMPFADLQQIDLGQGERIPLLDDVLRDLAQGDNRLLVNIELKSQPTWTWRLQDDGLASATAAIVRSHNYAAHALVSSFDPLLLLRFRRLAPEVATALLCAHDQALPYRRAWAARLVQPRALHPESSLVDARVVARWHARGLAVNVWTVDDPGELRLFAAFGVDGVITNRPALARSVLR
jgi:glycerophosphoryl diester phosphodiesterase